MNKLFRKISITFLLLMTFMLNIKDTYAANASISVSASSTNVSINSIVNVTVTVSESGGKLGAWNFEIYHDSSKLSLISGDEGVYGEVGDGSITSRSYSLKYKAIAEGSATISVSSANIQDWDSEESIGVSKGSTTINISAPQQPSTNTSQNATNNSSSSNNNVSSKNSDNNLKSLNIEGANLIPKFDKDTLEYNVELTSDTTKIKIDAESSDSNASISGIGEKDVTEGQNKIEIVVSAENGATRTYIINAYVKEKDPIQIKFSGEEYTILRKLDGIDAPKNFKKKIIKINENEVESYYNEKINCTLLALKNTIGDINLYIYDNDLYSKYSPISSNDLELIVVKLDKGVQLPKNYSKSKFNYNDIQIDGYAFTEESEFRLIYAINVEDGKKGFYLYDTKQKTLQRYFDDQVDSYADLIYKCKLAFLILGGFIVFLTIIIITLLSKNVKFKTKYLNARLNPIDNPRYNSKNIQYQDLEGTRMMNKVDIDTKKQKKKDKKSKKTFLDE